VIKLPPLSSDVKVFLLRLFALIGVLGLLLLLVCGLYVRHYFAPEKEPKAPETMVLSLDFTQPITDRPSDFTFSLPALLQEEKETPLLAIVRAIELAKDDPRVKGLVARFNSVETPALSQAQEIATALQHFRASGKFTMSFASSYGSFAKGSSLYFLASQFEERWLQPVGSVGLTGLGLEAPFLKSALQTIGVQANFMQREEYKSVMENVGRDAFSPAVRANMQSMIDDLQNQIASGLAQSLKITPAQAESLIAAGPYTAGEALKAKLITRIGYDDEMQKEVEAKAGAKSVAVSPATYLPFAPHDDKEKPQVALIFAEGMISDAPQSGPSRLADQAVIDTDALVEAFNAVTKNPKVKAVLFRINSPGGSPTASETIRRAMIRAKESGKPIFVSMGQVAASGGYWIAMDANHIVADPATLTGSIGVVGGKFVLGGLYDKLNIKWDSLTTHDNAMLWTSRHTFGPKEQERMNAMLDETYQTFVSNVSAARKIPMNKMPNVAKGRVFTGAQALKVGLVDELGGMDETIASIKRELKLAPTDKIALTLYPPRETARVTIMRMIRSLASRQVLFGQGSLGSFLSTLSPLWAELNEPSAVRIHMPSVFLKTGW